MTKRVLTYLAAALIALAAPALRAAGQDRVERAADSILLTAVQLYEDGRTSEAAANLKAIVKHQETNDAAHYYLGLCELLLDDIEQAEYHLERAAQLDSTNFWYRYRLAALYGATGRKEQTLRMYEKLLEDFPKKTDIYYSLAEQYSAVGRLDDAIAVLDKIDTLAGPSEGTAMARFRIMCYQKRQPEAYEMLSAFNEEYSSPQVLSVLADYHLSLFDDKKALSMYDEALEMAPGYPPAMLGRAEVFRMTRRYNEYFAALGEFVGDSDIDVEGKNDYIRAFLQQTDPKFIKQYATQMTALAAMCAQTHPADSVAAQNHCLMVYQTDDLELLAKLSESYLETFPGNAMLTELVSYSNYNLERYDKVMELSRKEYDAAVARGDRKAASAELSTIGDLYHMMGDSKKAYKSYIKSIKLDPDNVGALNNYAYYLCCEGKKLSKAAQMSRHTIELEPDNPTYLDTFGWILHLQGKDVEAKAIFKHAMLYGGKESAVILEHYADVLSALGETDLASMYYRQAKSKK